MSYHEFAVFLAENLDVYIKCLLLAVFVYVMLLYKQRLAILDPLTLVFIGSMFGFSVILFLRATEEISDYYFYQYLLTQVAFFIGFLSIRSSVDINISKLNPVVYEKQFILIGNRLFYWFVILSFSFIVFNLIIYKVSGIPLFAEYRLAVASGGGLGILKRVLRIVSPASFYLCCYFLFNSKKKFSYRCFAIGVLIFHCIVAVLSGSKSAFFTLLQYFFLYCILNAATTGNIMRLFKKYQISVIFLALFLSMFTIIVQGDIGIQESIGALMFRFVSFGDTYYMAYPTALIEDLSKADFITVMFGDLLRTIRIFPENMAPPGIGFELYNLANQSIDAFAGPNPRHNIYGYVNFGFIGSVLFSLACGLILSSVRRIFYRTKENVTQDRKILILLCYLAVVPIEVDPPSSIMYINNTILIFPVFLVINNILKRLSKI